MEGSNNPAPTVKNVTFIFAFFTICKTFCANSGDPSSMAKAKLLGRVQANKSGAVGILLGILKVVGTVEIISIREIVIVAVVKNPFSAKPTVLVLSILKWDRGT